MATFTFLAACGGSSPDAPARPSGPAADMVATAAGPDDVVVAQVGGRPVWGSCVAAQAARAKLSPQAALRECVDFELMAQAAETRGLATDPEVIAETRRAAVSRFVETAFESTHRLEDMLPEIERRIAADPMKVLERRNSAFIRVNVPAKAPPEAWIQAKIVADRIHAELGEQTGLFKNHLEDVVRRVAANTGFEVEASAYKLVKRGQSSGAFEEALFAIPEVGRVSPVTRTQWGWDIILLTEHYPAKQLTREEVLPLAYAELRNRAFERWIGTFLRDAQITRNTAPLETQQGAP